MRLLTITLSLALTLLATGCASVKPTGAHTSPAKATSTSTSEQSSSQRTVGACTEQQQQGCVELRVGNYQYKPESENQKGIDKSPASQVERQERAQKLGPLAWQGFVDGRESSSKPRSFILFFWNVNEVPPAAMSAWRVNGDRSKQYKHVVSKGAFEEIKDGSYPIFDPAFDLGKPQRVYRISASGSDPIGASLQIPWSMVTDKTYVLICTEDKLTVYPNKVTANDGLWLTPSPLKWYRDTRKSTRVLIPFISKDG